MVEDLRRLPGAGHRGRSLPGGVAGGHPGVPGGGMDIGLGPGPSVAAASARPGRHRGRSRRAAVPRRVSPRPVLEPDLAAGPRPRDRRRRAGRVIDQGIADLGDEQRWLCGPAMVTAWAGASRIGGERMLPVDRLWQTAGTCEGHHGSILAAPRSTMSNLSLTSACGRFGSPSTRSSWTPARRRCSTPECRLFPRWARPAGRSSIRPTPPGSAGGHWVREPPVSSRIRPCSPLPAARIICLTSRNTEIPG